jgi:hypothetical protein
MYICGDTNVDLPLAESGYVPNLFGCLPLESPPQVKILLKFLHSISVFS